VVPGELNERTGGALVTGATGSVGPALVDALCESPARIRIVARRLPPRSLFHDRVEFMAGDIALPEIAERAMAGMNIVYHLAAKLHSFDPHPELRDEYERVNVTGTQNLIVSAMRHKIERFVFFSTINIYGSCSGKLVDETCTPRPEGIYAQSKLRAEQVVLQAHGADHQPLGTILRLAAVYGPRIKGNYQKLVKALDKRRFVQIGAGTNRRTLIHERDLARAAILAGRHPAAAGQIFNVSDGQNHSLSEILRAICRALGRKPPRLSLPARPVRALVGILEDAAGMFGVRFPIKRALLDKYLEDAAIDSTKIQDLLGFSPQFDLISGWEETIVRMRERGDL